MAREPYGGVLCCLSRRTVVHNVLSAAQIGCYHRLPRCHHHVQTMVEIFKLYAEKVCVDVPALRAQSAFVMCVIKTTSTSFNLMRQKIGRLMMLLWPEELLFLSKQVYKG